MSLPNSKIEHPRVWRNMRLSWRIWWLVFAVATLVIGAVVALWRLDLERDRANRPGEEIIVRDLSGHEIGYAQAVIRPRFGPPTQFQVVTEGGEVLWIELPPPPRDITSWASRSMALWSTLGWGSMVVLVAVLAGLVSLPLVRRLTRRLEGLQQGVRQWGEGDLAVRLPAQGDDEVADLARHFNAAADRVEALVASHKHLLAHASHELRSPLARIRMGLALLADAPERADVQREIERNVAELDQLVDEVLLASRLEHNPDGLASHEPVDLLGLVAEEAARVGAQVHATAAVEVLGDAVLLRRMVRNLLENARRHGVVQGQADIDVDVRNMDGRAVLSVADRGPGVPEAWREHIFEPFVRVPGAQEKHGSVGLGLALVRLIAQRHGARVGVQAREGGGSVFLVNW